MLNIVIVMLLISLLGVNLAAVARDIRHPVNIFLASWCIMILLLAGQLINYVFITPLSYIYIILSVMAFWISSILAGRFRIPLRTNYDFLISDSLLLLFGYSGLAIALLYYQTRFGLINLIVHPGEVRASDTGGTGFLGLIIFLPTIVFTVLLIQAAYRKRYNLGIIIYSVALLAYMVILPERTTLTNTLVWTSLGIFALQSKPQFLTWRVLRRYVPRMIVFFALILGFFITVSARTEKIGYLNGITYALNYQKYIPRSLYDPYIYITGNVPALSVVVEETAKNKSLISFNPDETAIFYKRFGQLVFRSNRDSSTLTSNKEFASIPFAFNTYTWLSEPLHDYGLLGSLFYVLVCGGLCGLGWAYRMHTVNPLSCFLYSWGATACLFTIMTNKFSSIYFNYSIVIVVFLYSMQYLTKSVRIPAIKFTLGQARKY